MKKHRPIHAVLRAIILMLIFPVVLLSAATEGQEPVVLDEASLAVRYVLLSAELDSANLLELQSRAQFVGISDEGPLQELRDRLYAYYDLTPSVEVPLVQDRNGVQTVEIVSADRIYLQGSGSRYILLDGNTELSFTPEGTQDTTDISAQRMVIDLEAELVTALGSVSFRSIGITDTDHLEGEIVTIRWKDGSLLLSDGGTGMTRENSEGKVVEFYTTGSEVYFSGKPRTIVFSDGFITTNREQAYFSIAASSMYVVDGGDLFVTNARMSLGRVPLLWIPFFYYPGKTFVFNPSFGFDSGRGFFFSSSTELYGRYPKIERAEKSSFTALLTGSSGNTQVRDGWVYSDSTSEQAISNREKWALESSSYLALLLDAYQQRGVFLGFDTSNNFSDKQYVLSAFGGIAFPGELGSSLSSVYEIPPIRYAFNGKFLIDTKAVDVSLSIPIYSDPRVMRDYANRLTSFSLGAFGGDVSIPTTYRSDIASYDWLLTGTAKIPVKILQPFVESLEVERLSSKITWKAQTNADGPGYTVTHLTLPDFIASATGTLFKFSQGASTRQDPEPLSEPHDPAIQLEEYGIEQPYKVPLPATRTVQRFDTSAMKLGYTVRQTFTEIQQLADSVTTDTSRYARTAGTITLQADLAPSIVRFTQKIDPMLTINESDTLATRQISFTSTTDASFPLLGISYGLTTRLYNQTITKKELQPETEIGGWGDWSTDSVSRHQLAWQQSYYKGRYVYTPSLTATLDPLPFGLQPKFAFAVGKFSTSVSYKMEMDDSGDFVGEDAILSLSYLDKKRFEFSSTATYQGDIARTTSGFLTPLDLSNSLSFTAFDAYLTIEEKSEYSFEDKAFDQFLVSAAIPWASISVQGSGKPNDPVFNLLDADITIDAFEKQWWKNRISLGLDITSAYRHSFWDASASNFSFKINLAFSIAEFLSIDFALKTVNKGFHRYSDFTDMWQDLLRSFDFMGDGRSNTQFTMESVELSVIHHMADWDLHCKYEGSVVLSDLEWRWNPVFTVFLQWKAIPEIKVDRQFDVGH
jgi:hypothetical protein